VVAVIVVVLGVVVLVVVVVVVVVGVVVLVVVVVVVVVGFLVVVVVVVVVGFLVVVVVVVAIYDKNVTKKVFFKSSFQNQLIVSALLVVCDNQYVQSCASTRVSYKYLNRCDDSYLPNIQYHSQNTV